MKMFLFLCLLTLPVNAVAQNYSSFLTGNSTDLVAFPSGGVCLMGGATEDDNAMKWFLRRANGGDILVLRATGSNGYNNYLYAGLGIPVNSVETILCHNALASRDPYVLQRISKAEAIWFAGGDQWTYLSYWRNSPVDSAINVALQQRNIVIGGTSAGMAIQGKYYFSAQNGTVTSTTALVNPFSNLVSVDSARFLENFMLSNTITDTHFDNPDRKGRLMTFLARIISDYGVFANAIACDEYTAVCIDTNGIARVFGGFPAHDDNAYFIQSNCELPIRIPETCLTGSPLTWSRNGLAVKAYQIKGDSTGSKTFNLATWQSGTGGMWRNWSVTNGQFLDQAGMALNCITTSTEYNEADWTIAVYPNPSTDVVHISIGDDKTLIRKISLISIHGRQVFPRIQLDGGTFQIQMGDLSSGVYWLRLEDNVGRFNLRRIIKN